MKVPVKIIYILLSLLMFAGITSSNKMADTADRPIAIVKHFKPNVKVQNMEANKEIMLDLEENKGEQLFSGDSLTTDEQGFALVMFMDASVAKVKPQSLLIINGDVGTSSKAMSTRIDLKQGEIFLNVEPQGENDFEVSTSRSLASVKGTDFGNKANGYIWVGDGQVDVTALNSGQTVSLFEKMFAQVDEQGNNIESGTLSDDELNQLGEGYDEMESDLVKKEIILKFRDQNGQLREITIEVFEEQN